jgi:PAS domain S-box-containing protein
MSNSNLPYHDYLTAFSRNENAVKIIFDQTNHRVVHISENVEQIFGYKSEEICKDSFRFEQLICPCLKKWLKESCAELLDSVDPFKFACCGVNAVHKNGQLVRILARYHPMITFTKDSPIVVAISIDDVTHLLKSNFHWAVIDF